MGPRIRSGISRRLEDIVVLVQSNLAFLTFTDLHKTWSNCLGLSSSIFDFGSIFSVVKKLFFGCICGQLNNEQGETVKILFYSENTYKIH